MAADGNSHTRREAVPEMSASPYGPANACRIRWRRSSMLASAASTKNAGEPKKIMNPALLTVRP
jgi:hypothetical protein